MTVVEDLLLRLRTAGATEAASSVDRVRKSVKHADDTAKHASKSHKELGASFSGLTGMARNAAGIVGIAGLAGGVGEAVKSAESFQESTAQLGASIHANVRHPAREATAQMGEFADSLSTRGGFDPTQNIQGMTQFLRVTHDTSKAQQDMTLATNVARGAHVDLGRAVKAVMQAENGRTTGLARLGVATPKVTTAYDQLRATHKKATAEQIAAAKATDTLATKQGVLANASKEYTGATARYSHSAAGGIANMRNAVEVLSTKFGTLLLPIVQKVTGFISKFVGQMLSGKGAGGRFVDALKDVAKQLENVWKWIKQNKEWLEALAASIGSLILAYKAWKIVTDIVKGAQEALNAVADMNPWVLAIMAVIAIVVLLYTKFKWFRDFAKNALHAVSAAFSWVKNAVADVFDWVKGHWPLLLGILAGPIGLAVSWILTHLGTVKGWFSTIIGWFKTAWKAVKDAIVWPFNEAWKGIKWVVNKIIDGVNLIISGLNHIHFKLPHWVPFVGGKGFGIHISPLGHLQSGGTVGQGGAYVVGEGGPELVTLPHGASVSSQDDLRATNQLLRELIRAVQANSQMLVVDGKVLAQSVMRQGLLQQSRS